MTTTQEAPGGERLAKLEATTESLVREVVDVKSELRDVRSEIRDIRTEIRDLRSMINRNLVTTLGLTMSMWVTLIIALLLRT